MAIKISEAEAEQQKILAMQKGLFDLGRAAQQNQEKINIDANKKSVKKKLFDQINLPKIPDKYFQYNDDLNIILQQISDDKVSFACNNYEEYQIYENSDNLQFINDRFKVCFEGSSEYLPDDLLKPNSNYLIIDNWKSYPNDKNLSQKLYIRNNISGKSYSNKWIRSKQKENDLLTGKQILKLENKLNVSERISHKNASLLRINPVNENLKLDILKKLILIYYFLSNDIKKINKDLNEKEMDIKNLDKLCDEQSDELVKNEELIDQKNNFIKSMESTIKLIKFQYTIFITFLSVINLFTLYSAIYGFDKLTNDSKYYVLDPIIYVFTTIIQNPFIRSCILTYYTVLFCKYLLCEKDKEEKKEKKEKKEN